MVPDAQRGYAVEIDKRAAAWFFYTFYPNAPGTVWARE